MSVRVRSGDSHHRRSELERGTVAPPHRHLSLILPATIRDATYVAANMRPEDWREIACQCPDGLYPYEVAAWALQGREAWIATVRGQPVACFGVHNQTSAGNVLAIWAWGTRGMWRAIPSISRFILDDRVPAWIEAGVTRVEARSIAGHEAAHRWMRGLGAAGTELKAFGKGGEDFTLFWWTQERWTDVFRRRRR